MRWKTGRRAADQKPRKREDSDYMKEINDASLGRSSTPLPRPAPEAHATVAFTNRLFGGTVSVVYDV